MTSEPQYRQWGFRHLHLSRVPSWAWPDVEAAHGRFGAWKHRRIDQSWDGGFSLRFRDFVFVVSR